jgi:flagellin
VTGQYQNASAGGLGALSAIDVSTAGGASTALGNIESLIQTSIDAAAAFGSVEGRIETQAKFISSLSDSLKSGIGAMVDADMEEASARLQALQVQQQLGIQSLSIANQAPQSILSLFR